jgi:hypothetical protein
MATTLLSLQYGKTHYLQAADWHTSGKMIKFGYNGIFIASKARQSSPTKLILPR